jgi:UDP-glucose:(heptosyl)LPS alpha-1,3-glucosyltransferase
MRIAVISRVFSKSGGGAESYSVAIVQQLTNRHDIHVFAQETNHPVSGVTYHPVFCLSRKPRWINQLLFAMATWWRTRRGFDVVHSHENTWHGQIQTIHVRPLRLNLLDGHVGTRRALRWLKVFLSPRLMTYVYLEGARFKPAPGRHVVVTSETLKIECEQTYPASRQLMSVITPGTDLQPDTPTRAMARRQLGLPTDSPLLLFVANDYARKGLDTLLLALAQLPPDVQLAVAGNPAPIARYRQKVEQLGLKNRVHFFGSLDDLSPAYRAADCLVHPTLEDSFAMVVLEAMAHGLPVVVSGPAYCGISRQLQDGVQALLLQDPRDAGQLARLITKVLQQPSLADQLRRQALSFAQQHTWHSAALQYETLYRQAASANLHDR